MRWSPCIGRLGLIGSIMLLPWFCIYGQTDTTADQRQRALQGAVRQVLFGADHSCYPEAQRRRLHAIVDTLLAPLKPTALEKVTKRYHGDVVRAALDDPMAQRSQNMFMDFAQDVVDTVRLKCPAKTHDVGLGRAVAADEWPEYNRWRQLLRQHAADVLAQTIPEFETRYGSGEMLNWLEVWLDNWMSARPFFGATKISPSPWEPIARLTALSYNSGNGNVASLLELGVNHYAFSGWLTKLNPIGLAISAGNPDARQPIRGLFYANDLHAGVMVHVRKIEAGMLWGRTGKPRLVSTVNVQVLQRVLPGVF